jgi:hypothetical protein
MARVHKLGNSKIELSCLTNHYNTKSWRSEGTVHITKLCTSSRGWSASRYGHFATSERTEALNERRLVDLRKESECFEEKHFCLCMELNPGSMIDHLVTYSLQWYSDISAVKTDVSRAVPFSAERRALLCQVVVRTQFKTHLPKLLMYLLMDRFTALFCRL